MGGGCFACRGYPDEIQDETFVPYADIRATVSVSIGLAGFRQDDTVAAFFQRADNAMYKAKAAGRNSVYGDMEV